MTSRPVRVALSLLILLDPALLLAAGPKSLDLGARAGAANAALQPSAVSAQIPALAAPAISAAGAAAAAASAEGAQSLAPRLEVMSEGVQGALDAAGPLSEAAAEDAAGAGDKAQKALEGDKRGATSAEPAAPAAPAAAPAAPSAPAEAKVTPEQLRKLRTLKFVVSMFTEHYEPIEWKKLGRNVDFMKEYQAARAEVIAKPEMKQQEFQRLLGRFADAAQDYHVGISFYSTESSKLPITVLGADGKYYIADINRDMQNGGVAESQFPFAVGDEIVEFGGKPVAEVVQSLKKTPNTQETDERLAQAQLTARGRRRGFDVPQGDLALKIKTADGSTKDAKLVWSYSPELIPSDVPPRGDVLGPEVMPDPSLSTQPGLRLGRAGVMETIKRTLREFLRPMAHPFTSMFLEEAADAPANGFMIGGKKSFVPPLGEVVWPSTAREKEMMAQFPFHAYIYKNEQGQNVGYVRISDYMADGKPQQYAQAFGQLISMFEKKTDALVIDQVNNPGGNVFYMYTLLSLLTEKPLKVPPHRMMIGESDAKMAADILKQAENQGLKKLVERAIMDEMLGFTRVPADAENPVVGFAKFILSELKAGRRSTNPVHLFGVGEIEPQPMVHYTKPIVVLINELDFSAGDFFPAILKDNGRATLFGVRTAGAGGAVKSLQWPNQDGIDTLSYTWTIAIRLIGQVIENLGITPDVFYQITGQDIRDGFQGYKKALNQTVKDKIVSARISGEQKPAEQAAPEAPAAMEVEAPEAQLPAPKWEALAWPIPLERILAIADSSTRGLPPLDARQRELLAAWGGVRPDDKSLLEYTANGPVELLLMTTLRLYAVFDAVEQGKAKPVEAAVMAKAIMAGLKQSVQGRARGDKSPVTVKIK